MTAHLGIAGISGLKAAVATEAASGAASGFSSGAPDLLAVGDSPVLRTPGGVTGIGDHWSDPGWRPERSTTAHDPWNPTTATPIADGEQVG
ncbi:hypothetical protein, partial [Rathayibacter rathayi]|uniref:hypothetical protein n=1 Tax=Rathayibacter rathayi TaxID=33887 RepID=UPI0015E350ED